MAKVVPSKGLLLPISIDGGALGESRELASFVWVASLERALQGLFAATGRK